MRLRERSGPNPTGQHMPVRKWDLPLGGSGEGARVKPHRSCLVQGELGAEMEDGSSDTGQRPRKWMS